MSLLEEIAMSIRHYSDAMKLIRRHNMYPLLFVSFFLFLILLALCVAAIYAGNAVLIDWILNLKLIQQWHHFFNNQKWIVWLFKLGIHISTFFLFISFYKFVFLAVASPLYAYIAEKSAEKYKGITFPFHFGQFIKDIIHGIRISIRNLFKQLLLTLLLFILSFIPLIGLVFSFFIILLDAYYYGFAMIDYSCERDKKTVRESVQFIHQHRGVALGNGLIFYACMVVLPVIGVIFIAPISAIAATISYYQITEKR